MQILYTTSTGKRVYRVTLFNGLFHAEYQPINQTTLKPWLAVRSIQTGHDCYRNWNKEGVLGEIIFGVAPKLAFSGYSTEQLAIQAIKNKIKSE